MKIMLYFFFLALIFFSWVFHNNFLMGHIIEMKFYFSYIRNYIQCRLRLFENKLSLHWMKEIQSYPRLFENKRSLHLIKVVQLFRRQNDHQNLRSFENKQSCIRSKEYNHLKNKTTITIWDRLKINGHYIGLK